MPRLRDKNKKQLLKEIAELRQRVAVLERTETGREKEVLPGTKEELKTILDEIRHGIILLDLKGKIISINKKITEISEYTKQDIVGKRLNRLKLFPPQELTVILTAFAQVISGKTVTIEVEVFAKTGKKLIVEIDGTLLRIGGKTEGVIAFLKDITARRQAENALRESEEELEAIFNAVRDGIVLLDLTGKIIKINKRIAKITEYSEKYIVGKRFNFFKNFPPQSTTKMVSAFTKMLAGQRVSPFEVVGYTKSGEKRIGEMYGSLLQKRGKPVGVLVVMVDITERKQAEEALRKSEQKYRTILETMEDGYFEVDLRGNFVFFNEALCRIHGRSRDEMMGMNNREYTTPETAKRIYAVYNKIYKTGIPAKIVDYEVIRKDGSLALVEDSVLLLRNAAGEPVGFCGVSRERTEKKRAETAIRESEERYRSILESMEEGYAEVDLRGNFNFFNEALCRIHGRSREEMMALNNQEYMTPETAKRIFAVFNKVYRTGIPAKIVDNEIIRKDGSIVLLEESVALVRNAAGEPIGFRGVSRDRTEQKRAEEALRQSEEKYRTILENIEDGYYEVDLSGNFLYFNDSLCRIYGYTRDEMTEMNNRAYMSPETARKSYLLFNEVYKTRKPAKIYDWEFVKKDGSTITVEISVSLMRDSTGEPIGFRGIVRDITERKRAEEALREREENYRNILELTPDSITITRRADGRYLQVNKAFCQHTGYSVEEVVGQTTYDLGLYVDPTDRERLQEAVRQHGRADGLEIQFRAKDGAILEDLVSARPIRFQGQDCNLVVATNINTLKQAQQALRESEQKYRTILQTMEEGYYEVDLRGNITFCNEAECRIHGRSRDELIGMNNREFSSPETAKRIYVICNKVYRTGIPAKIVDYEIIRQDGSIALLETSASLLHNAAGEPIGFYGVSRDRTKQKKAEEALRESEEKYRSLVEFTEDSVYLVNRNKEYLFINKAYLSRLGLLRDHIIGRPYCEFHSPEDDKIFSGHIEQVLKTGRFVQYEHRSQKNGRYFLRTLSPVKESDGHIEAVTVIAKDITERKRAEAELVYMATHDILTGLPNRMLFNDRLTMALTQARRSQKKLAVMLLDLDYFKDVNDSLGHDVGDQLLRAVSKRLRKLLRRGDTVARIGGDEFLLLLPEMLHVEYATTIAQKILQAFQEPFTFDDHTLPISASIGIATYPEDGDDTDTLMKNADIAMYRAKDKGRGRFER